MNVYQRCQRHRRKKRKISPVLLIPFRKKPKSLKFFAGVADTAEKFISGVVDTSEQYFGGVVDTGDKF
jgi:hypothetical protein